MLSDDMTLAKSFKPSELQSLSVQWKSVDFITLFAIRLYNKSATIASRPNLAWACFANYKDRVKLLQQSLALNRKVCYGLNLYRKVLWPKEWHL